MQQAIKVGIIGEFDPNLRYHVATNEALTHAADALSISLNSSWVSTQSLTPDSVESALGGCHGFLCAPGDYSSMDGAHRAIQFAREGGRPFIGT